MIYVGERDWVALDVAAMERRLLKEFIIDANYGLKVLFFQEKCLEISLLKNCRIYSDTKKTVDYKSNRAVRRCGLIGKN